MQIEFLGTSNETNERFLDITNSYQIGPYTLTEEISVSLTDGSTYTFYNCNVKTGTYYPTIDIETEDPHGKKYKISFTSWSNRTHFNRIDDQIKLLEEVKDIINTIVKTFNLTVVEG